MKDQFVDDVKEMNETGAIYRRIVERFGENVDLIYADPRNMITIFTYMVKQLWCRNIDIVQFLKNILWGARRGAMFLDGRWLNKHSHTPEELIGKIQQQMR